MDHNIKLVTHWGIDRGLVKQNNDNQRSQFIKGVEEGGEIFEAIVKRDKELLVDAIGDRLVVLTLECVIAGLNPRHYIRHIRDDVYSRFESFNAAVGDIDVLHYACIYGMLQGEFARSVAKQLPIEKHVTDTVLALNNLSTLLCVDIGECYRTAYLEIKDRTGSTVDGVFVKDE